MAGNDICVETELEIDPVSPDELIYVSPDSDFERNAILPELVRDARHHGNC